MPFKTYFSNRKILLRTVTFYELSKETQLNELKTVNDLPACPEKMGND